MEQEENLPLNKQVKRVKMYGTQDSKFHAHGEETLVDPSMVEHFKERGYSLEKPEPLEEDDDKEED